MIKKLTDTIRLSPLHISGVIVITVIGIFLYSRYHATLITVNGDKITRSAYLKELERLAGERAINVLITEKLIYQEAKRQNITIPKKEIDDEIKTIEANLKNQNKTLEQALKEQHMTRDMLYEQIETRKISEKIAEKHVKVSEQEVINAINRNRAQFPQQITPEMEKSVRNQIYQQKVTAVIQTLIAELRKKATIEFK